MSATARTRRREAIGFIYPPSTWWGGGLGLPVFLAGEQANNLPAAELFKDAHFERKFARTESCKAGRERCSGLPTAKVLHKSRTESSSTDVGRGSEPKQRRRRHLPVRKEEVTPASVSCLDPASGHVFAVGDLNSYTAGLCSRSRLGTRHGSPASGSAPWLEVAYSPLAHRTALVQERLSQHGYVASSCSSMSLCVRDSRCFVRIPEFLLLFQFLVDCRTALQEVLDRLRRLSRDQQVQLQQLQQERLQKLRQLKHFEQQQRRAWAHRQVLRQQAITRPGHAVEPTDLPNEGESTKESCCEALTEKHGFVDTLNLDGRRAHERRLSRSHGEPERWRRSAGYGDTGETGFTLLPSFLLLRVRVSFPTLLLAGDTMEEPPSVVVCCGFLQVRTTGISYS